MDRKKQVSVLIAELKKLYPDSLCSLTHEKDYELMISVRLSAQCTDARVNEVTPTLFAKYPTLHSLAEARPEDVEEIVKPCGFYHNKAKDIVAACRMLEETYGSHVPDSMEELLKLPGVGRKTANLLLGDLYGKPAVVCDTHCIRITNRLGLTTGKEPEKVEQQLWKLLPPEESNNFCHRMVLHGRAVCIARKPDCEHCTLASACDYALGGASNEG